MAYEQEYGLVIRVDVLSQHLYDPGPYPDWMLLDYHPDGTFDCVEVVSWGAAKTMRGHGRWTVTCGPQPYDSFLGENPYLETMFSHNSHWFSDD